MTTLEPEARALSVGWASVDISPDRPVLIAGQFHARVSEGLPDVEPRKAVLNATHTHDGPEVRKPDPLAGNVSTGLGVAKRFELQKTCTTRPAEIHVIRLGDLVFASNPFEYYLDHGMHIKACSPAAQTFIVQLAGSGTYVPSRRSLSGGGYGSLPASNPIGPEGGEKVAARTVECLLEQWAS